MEKVYRTKIDLRVLGDKIKFNFFISGKVIGKGINEENLSKRPSFNFSYNTMYPVDVILKVKDGVQRVFLYFDEKIIEFNNVTTIISVKRTPLILEVFKNSKGNFGFEQIIGNGGGAFLSHKNYFSTSLTEGSIKPFGKIIGGKSHALQMMIPNVRFRQNMIKTLSFDMDILVENCEQYAHSLDFKLNIDESTIIKGDIFTIKPVKQIITPPTKITLKTTYLTLKPKDLADREVIYDYKKQLTPQNVEPETLELISSNVYAVQNPLTINADLTDINLTKDNNIQIPYNISRYIENNEVKESNKIFSNGKYRYPLNWVNEMQDNQVLSQADKCYSLKFATKTQLTAFTDKLKHQQIGNIENYPRINNQGKTETIPRNYSKISQWVERSSLNSFNDVRFNYDVYGDINSIVICPRKESIVGPEKIGNEKGLFTKGGEYLLPSGLDYIGDYHIHSGVAMVGAKHTDKPHETLTPLFTIAPISANTVTDFCFSTYTKKDESEVYTGFTVTSGDANIPNKTYDLHLSAASFSAETIIPISDVETLKTMRLVDDTTLQYRPYAFSSAYGRSGGTLIFNESDVDNYLTYSAITSGVYRFTYKAYLNIKYTDTQWCQYLETSYPSGFTGTYPGNDYEIKRLINTSIIQAGDGEKEAVSLDTNFKYNSGEKYRNCYSGREKYVCGDAPTNTGILNFDFTASLIQGSSTGGTGTTLTEFKIVRSRDVDGSANAYLTLDVDKNDLTTSGMNSCVLSSMTSSTIFHKQIPVTLDSGLINLISGQTIQLKYKTDWNTTSKGGFYDLAGGATALDINLGHKLNMSGQTLELPYYRGVKASNGVLSKKLFFDSTKKSIPFELKVGGVTKTVELDGTLYLSDSECGNIKTPHIDNSTFGSLTFMDTTAPDNKLVWDISVKKPSNTWQRMIEGNDIKDYVLSDKSKSKMTTMSHNGIFRFYTPTYNSNEYGAKCDFNFPQLSQSYVILNKFKNYYGNILEHYIVVTPDCGFHKPCSGTKVTSTYDIIHKTTPADWKVLNLNRKLNIKGKEVNIISSYSHYNPEPETRQSKTTCKYYCKCSQELASKLKLDPIYGITNIFSDLSTYECNDCLENAQEYCSSLNTQCTPHLVGDCAKENIYLEQVINNLSTGSAFYSGPSGSNGSGPPIKPPIKPPPVGPDKMFSCEDGLCFEDDKGYYRSYEDCVAICSKRDVPPPPSTTGPPTGGGSPPESDTPSLEDTLPDDTTEGVCTDGYYWCESSSTCISIDKPCT